MNLNLGWFALAETTMSKKVKYIEKVKIHRRDIGSRPVTGRERCNRGVQLLRPAAINSVRGDNRNVSSCLGTKA